MTIRIRSALMALGASAAVSLSSLGAAPAQAAVELDKPECLAPAKPGGGYDLTCRLAATSLQQTGILKKPMAVNYMPGGIGAVAYNHVMGVRDDDPNLIVAASTGAALNLAEGKFGKYDGSEVRWLGAVATDYGAIVVREDAPWQNLDELMEDLKQNPGKVVFGAGGTVGSQDWMKAALTAKAADIDPRKLRYVAFEGGGESLAALLGNHIQVFTGDLSEIESQLKGGKVRVLAALSDERQGGAFADIPTAKEQGYDVEWPIWRGYYMGGKVSDEAYQTWLDKFTQLVKTDQFKQARQARGLFPFTKLGPEFDAYVKERIAHFNQLAKEMGLAK